MEIYLSSWILMVTIVTVTSTKCFHDREDLYLRSFLVKNENLPIVLESSDRISHQISNHILKILLEEVIGYRNVQMVSRNDGINVTHVLKRLSGCNDARCNERERSIPTTMVNIESWSPVGFDSEPWVDGGSVVDAGPLGPFGRFGWYVPSFTVDSFLKNEHIYIDHWRALQSDNVTKKLSSHCRKESCHSGCPGCARLLSSFRDFDQGVLQQQIRNLKLNVSVEWLESNLTRYVQQRTAARESTLFFNWVPNVLTAAGGYTRMKFPMCTQDPTDTPNNCDFEIHQLTKYVWSTIQTDAPKAFHVISSMSFHHEEYETMLQDYSNARSSSPRRFACSWLRQNKKKWSSWIPNNLSNKTTIYLGAMFPIRGVAWRAPGVIPGAEMAIDLINKNTSLLKDFDIQLEIKDTQCRRDEVMKGFIGYITNHTHKFIGILGPGCSDTAEPIAGVARHYNFVIISYSVEAVTLSNRDKYPYFFRTIPQINDFGNVYVKFFKEMDWKRIGTLITDGKEYTTFHTVLQDVFKRNNIDIAHKTKLPHSLVNSSLSQYLEDFRKKNIRIIIGDFYEPYARALLCQAYKMEMTPYNGYVWFLPGWFVYRWFDTDYYNSPPQEFEQFRQKENIPCSTAQMLQVLQGHFTLAHGHYDRDDVVAVGNMTVGHWRKDYMKIIRERRQEERNKTRSRGQGRIYWVDNDFAGYAYDAVWMYALALDKLLRADPTAVNSLHSHGVHNEFMKNLQATKFQGVSGQISFPKGADRRGIVQLKQFNVSTEEYSVVGRYFPSQHVEREKIKWYGKSKPTDGSDIIDKMSCSIESFRAFLGVTCSQAIIVANVFGFGFCFLVIGAIIIVVVRRYIDKVRKTRDRLTELGLMQDDHWLTLDQWELPRENVVLNRKLGQGAFGTVYGGEAMITESWVAVAVKTLQAGSSPEQKLEFLSEAETMKRFDHQNIVTLLGVCTRGEPAYAVMEFMLHGDLKTFLLSRRQLVGTDLPEAVDVSPSALTRMAIDVAAGMNYLHEAEYVHRDIACRNCLVHANKGVKIGDFGMARPMFDHGYYRFSKRGMLPVRWMAPESLLDGVFTPASDIWSFGVLLFEIVTFGSFPYQGLSNNEVLDYVRDGKTLTLSSHCSDDLRNLMLACWSANPYDRPTARQMVDILEQNPELISPFLEEPLASVGMDELRSMARPKNLNRGQGKRNLPSASSISSIFGHQPNSPGPLNLLSLNMQELRRSFFNKDKSPMEEKTDTNVDKGRTLFGVKSEGDVFAGSVQSIPSLHSSQESICSHYGSSHNVHSSPECSPMLPRTTQNDRLDSDNYVTNGTNRTFNRSRSGSSKSGSTPGSPGFSKHINIPRSLDEKTDSDYCSDNSKEWTHGAQANVAVV